MAAWASGRVMPWSSNMTRPGLTTATQNSGAPLPCPVRVSAAFATLAAPARRRRRALPGRGGGGERVLVEHFSVEHPDLHAAGPVRGDRGGAREIDVRAQRVERNPPFAVGLVARHLRAAEAARARDADA